MLKPICIAIALSGFACPPPAARTMTAFATPTGDLGKTGRVESVHDTGPSGTLYAAYEVSVRFDDGSAAIFDYGGASPFAPGDRVVVLDNGLGRG
jgi:hypothetical protein